MSDVLSETLTINGFVPSDEQQAFFPNWDFKIDFQEGELVTLISQKHKAENTYCFDTDFFPKLPKIIDLTVPLI